jgi:hypothetical protein
MVYRDPLLECADYLRSHGVKGNIGFFDGAFHVGLYNDQPPPNITLWNSVPIYYDYVVDLHRHELDDDWDEEP